MEVYTVSDESWFIQVLAMLARIFNVLLTCIDWYSHALTMECLVSHRLRRSRVTWSAVDARKLELNIISSSKFEASSQASSQNALSGGD